MYQYGCKDIPRFITGGTAMLLALYFIHEKHADWVILSTSSFLFLICATDTLFSKIPNLFNLLFILLGFAYNFHLAGPPGLRIAFFGMLSGLGLFLLPFIMGGMGAGDVKALAALGALFGPMMVLQVFIYTALFGGLMGLLQYLFVPQLRQTCILWMRTLHAGLLPARSTDSAPSETNRFPYAAAIAFGYYAYVSWGGLLKLLEA